VNASDADPSPRPATDTFADCWSKPPGTIGIVPRSVTRSASGREGQPARVLAIADRSQERLCARFRRMTARGISQPKTIVAMARELVGYLWAVLHPAATATRN
jgi:hypothetical protein